MNPKWRRYAPLGLVLSVLALLSAISLYIIQREWNLYVQISLALVVVGVAVYILLDPGSFRRLLKGRQVRHGSNAIVLLLAFTGILIIVNYFAFGNSKRWDLTEDKTNTLAPETIDTIQKLPAPVMAKAFFTPRINSETTRNLLEQYKYEAEGNLEYQFIDPEADPLAAQAAKITRDGTVVLEMAGRIEPVTFVTEKEMTEALIRLISNEQRIVYFLTGHGEHGIDTQVEGAYTGARQVLESKNYKVMPLNLLATNRIPEDADVIVIAGPMQPLASSEVDQLEQFLANGGSIIVMSEPLQVTDFGNKEDPLAEYLANSWNIRLGNDIVVDLSSQQPFVAVSNSYASHPITEKLLGLITYFPTVRSVTIAGDSQETISTELVFTSEQAWAETSTEELEKQQINPTEGEDLIGTVPLVVVGEKIDSGARMVVFGDSEFAADENFIQYGNGDLLINSVDWASRQEELINLTPKDPVQRVLVPPQRYTLGLILFISVFLLPGMIVIAGSIVWYQRRKQG